MKTLTPEEMRALAEEFKGGGVSDTVAAAGHGWLQTAQLAARLDMILKELEKQTAAYASFRKLCIERMDAELATQDVSEPAAGRGPRPDPPDRSLDKSSPGGGGAAVLPREEG